MTLRSEVRRQEDVQVGQSCLLVTWWQSQVILHLQGGDGWMEVIISQAEIKDPPIVLPRLIRHRELLERSPN